MSESVINISADSLRDDNPGLVAARIEIKRLGSLISTAIRDAHKNKEKKTIYELPTVFQFAGMTDKEARKRVYSHLIQHLQNKDFAVQLRVKQKRVYLLISWDTKLSKTEEAQMNHVLKSASGKGPLRVPSPTFPDHDD